MKKRNHVVIVTIYDPIPNFGNRLQNYAVQYILNNLCDKVETLSFEKPVFTGKQRLKALAQKLSNYTLPGDRNYWRYFPRKVQAFARFNKSYIATKHICHMTQIPPADYYILGSDQVWNTAWYDNDDKKKDLFLLTFADPAQKICFAPSFGTDILPDEWSGWFEKHLKTFPSLSVREEAGQHIIRNLTGKEAVVLIDPTMMLDGSDWMKIARKPKKLDCDHPYILTYFLGRRSSRANSDLQRLTEKYHARVYHLMDMMQPEVYVSGPSEFIYLISHAAIILTDSFHACVFSFLFGKPFLVYAREGSENNMMSRMDTLLKKFHLERKYANSGLQNDPLECDYREGYQVLAQERQKVLHYLKSAMHLEEQKDKKA